ncbi:MAG: Maf family protein [Proteobacteria bacterium]|nr:Maf family protein [Pseudomonadota bacterium]
MLPLILASSSVYRAQLMQRLRLPFETDPAAIDETRGTDEPAAALVERRAREKAAAVAPRHPAALVIGSDQVAVCGTDILGKPGTVAKAVEQLHKLAGRQVEFLTGLCLLNTASGRLQSCVETTPVEFRKLGEREIHAYVQAEQPLDCAGAFKSEGLGVALFKSIGGRDPSALIGLPLIALCEMLRAENCNPLLSED